MRRLLFPFLAAISAILPAAARAPAATRPRYGGTLRVEMTASVQTLDPAVPARNAEEAEDKRRLEEMLFDRLVRLDRDGRPAPQLAASWTHDAENKKWQFTLRPAVKLSNGEPLAPKDVATSLAAANPAWRVTVSEGNLSIETPAPFPGLPAELELGRNSIVHRGEQGMLLGTGPFRLFEWQPGLRAVLTANDDYWGGRPYVDRIEITLGRAPHDQLIDFELGKEDVIELEIDQLHRAAQENLRTVFSAPSELLAILFAPGQVAAADARRRRALALSVDREAIYDFLLQKQGEASGGLLPGWLSGYAFLFPAARNLALARQTRAGLPARAELTLGYDSSDRLAHAVAGRVALDARDAGVSVRDVPLGATNGAADARLVRMPLASADLRTALAAAAQALGQPAAQQRAETASPDDFYEIERALLEDGRVVPLFYLPEICALSPRVREWTVSRTGGWRPEAAWLAMEKP
jgi:peptide/nickel transport system substrate-binding protein